MSKEKISGIYCIENMINHKKYIGSSLDIKDRWMHHKAALRANRHHSVYLNNSWNKYGENNFSFYIIKECEKSDLIKSEQYYIDFYHSYKKQYGYNIQRYADRPEYLGASIEDLKQGKFKITYDQFLQINYLLCNTDIPILEISKIIEVNEQTLYKIYYGKQYRQIFNKDLFVKRSCIKGENHYNSVINEKIAKKIIEKLLNEKTNLEIAEELNINNRIVSDIRHHKAWNYLTKNITFPSPTIKQPNRYRKIIQYDKENNYINEFESVKAAMNYLGITSTGNLMSVLNGRRKTAYGYIWKYA